MKKLIISKNEDNYYVERINEFGDVTKQKFNSIAGVTALVHSVDEMGYTVELNDNQLFTEIIKELSRN